MKIVKVESVAKGFQEFSPLEHIFIDIANQYGFDKENFETRIATAKANRNNFRDFISSADEPALYLKAVIAYEDAMAGIPTGHVVGYDACSSGPQIMSAAGKCWEGCKNTGLIEPNVRADLYSKQLEYMKRIMIEVYDMNDTSELNSITRKLMKSASMPFFYSSDRKYMELFGSPTGTYNRFGKEKYSRTIESESFLDAMLNATPAAYEYRGLMLQSWQEFEEYHVWTRPDGMVCKVPVYTTVTYPIEVNELKANFTHKIKEIKGQDAYGEKAKSNGANIIQSLDDYIVDEIVSRCNHDKDIVMDALDNIQGELDLRNVDYSDIQLDMYPKMVGTNIILTYADIILTDVSTKDLLRAHWRLSQMLNYPSFEVLQVFDEFLCSPIHCNKMRWWYKEIMAEFSESTILEDIIEEITGERPKQVGKFDKKLTEAIRNSNYAIC